MKVLRIFLSCLLATFAVSASAQNANQAAEPTVPTVTFDCSWDQATPQKFTITVQSSGNAKYMSSSPTKAEDAGGVQDEYYATEFSLSAASREKVFHLAKDTGYFKGDFDYKDHPVASTGKKTLAFADKSRHFQTAYNHSENKSIQELTALFQGISSTIQHGRKLQFLRRFDKLGLEAELKGMEDENNSHFLAELQIISPILNTIADDSAIMNIARQRARRLLAKIGPE
jgi:Skp family chaperone for outer membrane proteins